VVDGDTIEVEMGGRRHTVRYIGIDTPEVADPRRPVMCYGEEASRRNRQLVEGKTILLEKDVSETDRYGRLLRYVWADGVFVNAALVQEGYARVYTVPPDVRYAELFRRLEREAREAGRGLWGASPAPFAPAGQG
jgi:micrococcal nuclease